MSSSADQVVFQESIASQDHSGLFSDKKYTYITDTSSNNGNFSGQLSFDLNTLSSQQNWTDLSEAYIQFPVKLSIKTNTAITAHNINQFSATIKNGFHHFVDSVQITIGGSTVQSSQIYNNIDTTYKMMTEWSKDEFEKFGPSLGLSLDDYALADDSAITTYTGLDNATIANLSPAYKGVALNDIKRNPGYKGRCNMLNNNASTTNSGSAYSILGSNLSTLGKGQAIFQPSGSISANKEVFALHAIGTIRLKDISDFCKKAPLMKGMKGFIYVNYNSAKTVYGIDDGAIDLSGAPVSSSIYGRCMPGSLNNTNTVAGTTPNLTFTAEISGTLTGDITNSGAVISMSNARLYAPYYNALPEIDRVLTTKKTFRYNESFVTTFNIGADGSHSGTLSPGIVNPNRVILYPYIYGTASATAGLTAMQANPLLSPWDTAPSTTSPFSALKNLQITVAGKQIFQSPVNMDYEQFLQEVSKGGLDGSMNEETTNSSLLNQRNWDQLYRFYTADLSRRIGSDDGASKSVQISCVNATGASMTVIAIIHYDREVTVDTALGQVTQNM